MKNFIESIHQKEPGLWCLAMLVILGMIGLPNAVVFGQDLTTLKSGVVKIINQNGSIGAGILVRVEPERAYIITASHVIAGDNQPSVQFYSPDQADAVRTSVKGGVMPGAQVNDDLRGLAVVVVMGAEKIPKTARSLEFETSSRLVSGGERAQVMGHPSGGGDWTVVKRDIANRQVHDIKLDGKMESRFSGGPILVNGKVVGMVTANQGEFGFGISQKSVLNYLDGIGIEPLSVPFPGKENGHVVSETQTGQEQKVLHKTKIGKDGAPMVLVPAGKFTMGAREDDKDAGDREKPAHPVYLDAFYIDQYEVTTTRYAQFFQNTKRDPPRYWSEVVLKQHDNKPVVGVNWDEAKAYCEWAGKRLPTEAEWEKAARGTDQRLYPWGNQPPTPKLANYDKGFDFKDYGMLTDVGSLEGGKSPYGAYDMAGNVWEWVADWYEETLYSQRAKEKTPVRNPRGPEKGEYRLRRGGSWGVDARLLRSSYRDWSLPSYRYVLNGFRCAQGAP